MDEALPVTTGHADPVQVLRVVVVDDHQMFTEALAATLSDEPDLQVVGTFGSTEPDLAAAVAGLRPDLVTVDVEPFDGPAARMLVERLTEPTNGPGVVALTAVHEVSRVSAAARAGALGWLSKEAPTGELLATLRAVAAGHACFPATYLGVVLRELVGELRRGGDRAGPLAVLSAQERRILAGMVAGESGPQIAARLYLSAGTVRTHTQNIFGKLGVHSRLEAVSVARRAGVAPEVAVGDR
jgi:two-component system, NarL family, response regulator LiaR